MSCRRLLAKNMPSLWLHMHWTPSTFACKCGIHRIFICLLFVGTCTPHRHTPPSQNHAWMLQNDNCITNTAQDRQITQQFSKFSLEKNQVPSATFRSTSIGKQEYILPTLQSNYVHKKTILDPLINPQEYRLPTYSSIVIEKVTPSLPRLTPIVDPHPLQRVGPFYH